MVDTFEGYLIQYEEGDIALYRIRDVWTRDQGAIPHFVREGETLQSIAFRYYGDSGYWAQLADANSIDDPLDIPVGTQINIPKL